MIKEDTRSLDYSAHKVQWTRDYAVWVAVKELKPSYHNKDTLLFTILYTHNVVT